MNSEKTINFDGVDKILATLQKANKKSCKFNKEKELISLLKTILWPLLGFVFVILTLMLFGVGNGYKYATDLIKETTRNVIPTALSITSLIVGYFVGKSSKPDKNTITNSQNNAEECENVENV